MEINRNDAIRKVANELGDLDIGTALALRYLRRKTKLAEDDALELAEDIAYKLDTYYEQVLDEALEANGLNDGVNAAEESPVAEDTVLSMDTHNFVVDGQSGTWRVVDHAVVDEHTFWMMVRNDTADAEHNGIIVDHAGQACLTRINSKDGFTTEVLQNLKLEITPVDSMPDAFISVEDMKAYGYCWGGMLPMGAETAEEAMQHFTVYRLYDDDTEAATLNKHEFKEHAEKGLLFGVEKDEWIRYIKKMDLVEKLAEKMQIELDEFHKMLFNLPSIKDAFEGYSYEYLIRNDIMMAMGECVDWDEWTIEECEALLNCQNPLQYIFDDIMRWDDNGDHMGGICSAIHDRAKKEEDRNVDPF